MQRVRLAVSTCLGAVVCALTALLFAAPASAHATLLGSNPEAGAEVERLPDRVSLYFNEPLQQTFAAVTLTDSEGNQWSDENVQVEGDTASVGVAGTGPAGTYTIAYRVISADSHPVSGTVEFTLTTGGTDTPVSPQTPAPEPPAGQDEAADSSALPAWPFILGAVAILAGGITVALRASRRS